MSAHVCVAVCVWGGGWGCCWCLSLSILVSLIHCRSGCPEPPPLPELDTRCPLLPRSLCHLFLPCTLYPPSCSCLLPGATLPTLLLRPHSPWCPCSTAFHSLPRSYLLSDAAARPGALLALLRDQYGNYVAQRALDVSCLAAPACPPAWAVGV